MMDAALHAYALALQKYVHQGQVDYEGLRENPRELNFFLEAAANLTPEEFHSWSREKQLALLLNLYNASTLKLILDHSPSKSIKQIGGIFTGPWKQKVVRLWHRTMTLDQLEHEIIRRQFQEARAHFALVCGANGCPVLRPEPYQAEMLSQQLEDQARNFLADPVKNFVHEPTKTIYLSPMFKWYQKDFEQGGKSLADFLNPFLGPELAEKIQSGAYRIRFGEYDWSLNKQDPA